MADYQLGPAYPGDFLTRTPGMSDVDAHVWREYWPHRFDQYQDLYYNVRVGSGAQHAKEMTPTEALNWWQITSRRIDIVGVLPNWLDVIEVRNGATPNAIGRLLEYMRAWWETPPVKTALRLVLITNTHDGALQGLCSPLGIRLIEVPNAQTARLMTGGKIYRNDEMPSYNPSG